MTHTLSRLKRLAFNVLSVMPRPHVHDIVLFGQPEGSLSPSRFCSSYVTPSHVGKGLIHIKGGHPL